MDSTGLAAMRGLRYRRNERAEWWYAVADGRTRLQARTAALARDGIIFSKLESGSYFLPTAHLTTPCTSSEWYYADAECAPWHRRVKEAS